MIYLYCVFFGLFFSIWRRWFGGGYENTWLKNNRGVQAAVFCLVTFITLFLQNQTLINVLYSLVITGWLYAQFWSRGHGACFDIGRDKDPTETTIARYNERWYHIPLDKIFKPENRYGVKYDFWYMFLRYVCPMLPMGLIDSKYILIGALVSPIYAICWKLSDKGEFNEDNKFLIKISTNSATRLAEYIVGFVYGYIVSLIIL